MSSELVVMNRLEVPTFQNEYLAESVRKIIECSKNIVANHFQIAYELAGIKKLELYKEAGFESVTDFAEKVFGFSKTSTSLAIKVAERYLIDEGDRIATTFLDTGTDFSFNQLRETLPLSERRVNSLVFEKRLKSTMTVKEIRSVVQEEKNKESFDVETQENKGINSESTIDISSISSSQEEHELKEETPLELPQNALESLSDSSVVSDYQNSSETPSEGSGTSQNSLSDSSSDSSISSSHEEHELKQSDIDFMISRLNELTGDEEEEEYPSAPYEFYFFNCRKEVSESKKVEDIELSELVYSDIIGRLPKELKDYIELAKKEIKRLNHFRQLESARIEELEEENKRLREENYKLLHPAKRKRGRPKKVQD